MTKVAQIPLPVPLTRGLKFGIKLPNLRTELSHSPIRMAAVWLHRGCLTSQGSFLQHEQYCKRVRFNIPVLEVYWSSFIDVFFDFFCRFGFNKPGVGNPKKMRAFWPWRRRTACGGPPSTAPQQLKSWMASDQFTQCLKAVSGFPSLR